VSGEPSRRPDVFDRVLARRDAAIVGPQQAMYGVDARHAAGVLPPRLAVGAIVQIAQNVRIPGLADAPSRGIIGAGSTSVAGPWPVMIPRGKHNACTRVFIPVEYLTPIGWATRGPRCRISDEYNRIRDVYVGERGHWWRESAGGAISPVEQWQREMARLIDDYGAREEGLGAFSRADYELAEARMVKLDHLMSVYGTTGRR
jgi:hypothetical protein